MWYRLKLAVSVIMIAEIANLWLGSLFLKVKVSDVVKGNRNGLVSLDESETSSQTLVQIDI